MDQTIRLLRPYAYHTKGKVLTIAPGIANELIRTGRAEAVKEVEAPEPVIAVRDSDFIGSGKHRASHNFETPKKKRKK